jgi:hypothetical protein
MTPVTSSCWPARWASFAADELCVVLGYGFVGGVLLSLTICFSLVRPMGRKVAQSAVVNHAHHAGVMASAVCGGCPAWRLTVLWLKIAHGKPFNHGRPDRA